MVFMYTCDIFWEYIKGFERVGLVDLLTCRATGDLVEAEGLEAEAVAAEEEASLDQCPQHDAADEVLVEEEGAREELRVIARDRDDRSEADAQEAHLQRDDVAAVGVVVQGAEQAKALKEGEAAVVVHRDAAPEGVEGAPRNPGGGG